MEDKEKLELERNELRSLIDKGVSFEVKDIQIERRGIRPFRKSKAVEVTRKFTINELTLATLDRISAEGIEMAIDEARLKGEKTLAYARGIAVKHARRCARIVAIAVLNESRLVAKPCRGGTRWVENSKEIDRLTDLFMRTVNPSMLYRITLLVNSMSNIGDFVNSIRLMQAMRTTMPNLIEQPV
ncbi:MAG: hypothetical protein NC324_02510 [Bacteroides sp.]|nr:hypothetical protein [Bacteroides sp.]